MDIKRKRTSGFELRSSGHNGTTLPLAPPPLPQCLLHNALVQQLPLRINLDREGVVRMRVFVDAASVDALELGRAGQVQRGEV